MSVISDAPGGVSEADPATEPIDLDTAADLDDLLDLTGDRDAVV